MVSTPVLVGYTVLGYAFRIGTAGPNGHELSHEHELSKELELSNEQKSSSNCYLHNDEGVIANGM